MLVVLYLYTDISGSMEDIIMYTQFEYNKIYIQFKRKYLGKYTGQILKSVARDLQLHGCM